MIRLKECIFQWGGGTINGDLHITGNLIIGDSDVSEDNQVTSDLIQDLYNKVYQPNQTIYVDQKIGNDDNDGTSLGKAVRTIDRAIDLIKDAVPNVTIQLNIYTKSQGGAQYNEFYVSKSIDCSKLDTMKFITTYEPYRIDHSVAKVHVPYVKMGTGIYDYVTSGGDGRQYYVWGHWMFIGPKDLYIQSVEFVFPEDNDVTITDSENYYNGIIQGTSGTKVYFNDFYNNSINIKNNCCYINVIASDIDILKFANGTITGKGILISNHQPRMFKDDPKIAGTDSKSVAGNTNGSKIIIDKINTVKTIFAGNILGESKQGFTGSNFKVGMWF